MPRDCEGKSHLFCLRGERMLLRTRKDQLSAWRTVAADKAKHMIQLWLEK